MSFSTIKPFLQDIGAAASQLGHELYIVGGYVRNKIYAELNGLSFKQNQDIDLVINTNAINFIYQYQKYLEDNDPHHVTFDILEEFKPFGTIKIQHPEYTASIIEIASTRTEIYSEPAAFPEVTIIHDVSADLVRRDFTINALLESLMPKSFGEISDHIGGIADMEKKLIRAFHTESFIDDPTRITRALRFMVEYDFMIEAETLESMLTALKHEDFPLWLKKRKNRFEIEANKIRELGKEKFLLVCGFLDGLEANAVVSKNEMTWRSSLLEDF